MMPSYMTAGTLLTEDKNPTDVENMGIRQKLAQVRLQMACAEDLFNTATDDAMLDTCIYQLKSLQVYYSYLIGQLKDGEQDAKSAAPAPEEGPRGLLDAVKERMMEVMG